MATPAGTEGNAATLADKLTMIFELFRAKNEESPLLAEQYRIFVLADAVLVFTRIDDLATSEASIRVRPLIGKIKPLDADLRAEGELTESRRLSTAIEADETSGALKREMHIYVLHNGVRIAYASANYPYNTKYRDYRGEVHFVDIHTGVSSLELKAALTTMVTNA